MKKKKQNVVDLFKAARRVSTPLIAFSTPDQNALSRKLIAAISNGSASEEASRNPDDPPILAWDCINGLRGVNDVGLDAMSTLGEVDPLLPLAAVIAKLKPLPPKSLIVIANAHRFVDDIAVAQAIYNLRDDFCVDRRTLVLLGPSFNLPSELSDVVLFDDPLPDDDELRGVLRKLYQDTYHIEPKKVAEKSAVDAARGLAAFPAEQVFAMSMEESGLNLDATWERKRVEVNKTPGLKFVRGGLDFDSLGGLGNFKDYIGKYVKGQKSPGVIVFLDEIEKQLAGATGPIGDSSGVSQDFLSTWLSWMEDGGHDGMIAVGPPGSGKTAGGMAIGATFDIPTVVLDVGGLKGSLVGESEQKLREAIKVINSIAGENGAFVFATCNRETALPPELKRRFRSGRWYFDLPTSEEKPGIWEIHLEKNKMLNSIGNAITVDDTDWTGAEIRNCVELAWRLGCSLKDAAKYIIPVAKSDPTGLATLRQSARNWLSASYPGPYRGPDKKATTTKPRREVVLSE